jgi:transposase
MDILAIDLGKSKSAACVFNTSSGEYRQETIVSTPGAVKELIGRTRPARVVIEIGGQAGWVCDACRELNVEVRVANTMGGAWKWKNTRRKSDREDALKLARLSAMGAVETVWVPEPRVRAWRELIGYRHALVVRRTAIKNTIRSLLTVRAERWPAAAGGWSRASMKRLGEMAAAQDGQAWRLALKQELAQLEQVGSSLREIEDRLEEIAQEDTRVELLQTIPGVGPRLAETIVAVIDNPGRFKNGKQVGCYAGLTPRRYQSGSMDRQGRISGQGNTLLRTLLVEVAWVGRQHNPWMKAVYEQALRGSPSRKKIAIVALARRLLVVCWAMMRDNRPWRAPAPQTPEAQREAKTGAALAA